MSEKKTPAVRPLRRYRSPNYPSWLDPDPTLIPTRVPYPLAPGLLAAVASAGLAAGCGGAVQAMSPAGAGQVVSNPFTVAGSNLPFRTSMFGTGRPSYLKDAEVRGLIESLMSEAGLELTADVRVDDGDVHCLADGVDERHGVGYVWGDERRLDQDAYIHWHLPQPGEEPLELEQLQEKVNWLSGLPYPSPSPAGEEAKNRARLALALEDLTERETALIAWLDQFSRDHLSMGEIQQLEDWQAQSTNTPRRPFVAVIPMTRYTYYPGNARFEHPDKWAQAQAIEDPEQRRRVTELLAQKVHEDAVREVLERLETDVRDWIAWARGQGAFQSVLHEIVDNVLLRVCSVSQRRER